MFANCLRSAVSSSLRRTMTSSGGSMEKSLNRVTLLGRVGIDPQMRGNDRSPVANFTLATNSNYMFESGEVQQKTEWHRISVFKPHLRDTVMRLLTKGTRVLVEGRLVYGEIVDANGNTQNTTSIVANEVVFLGTRAKGKGDAETDDDHELPKSQESVL